MSNQSQGAVLAGQPVAVTAGSGITIDPSTGVISVNAATITGVMKLNNGSAYNAYQWPNSPGTNGQFLQTNGAGLVDWADVQGFAVVTVSNAPPTPPTVGELWFDCDTGTLNVYQNCVGTPSPNWFNVAQPGFPVDPANTSAVPPFTNQGTPGAGTQANPYDCTVTTTGAGSSVFVVNTVKITGLAAFQYVPIVDLNAIANGGRFSFSNNYADALGVLEFQTIFKDQPSSPPTTSYTAAIKVGYGSSYIDAIVNIVAALTLPAGTITGTPTIGTAVSYTPGVATGGSGGYTYTYEWFRDGTSIAAPSANPAYTPVAADAGKILSVKQVVTDSSLATANATTTASAATGYSPIPTGTWNPGNAMNNSVPGTSSGTWGGATGPVTSDGCVVLSTDGTNWSQSVTATNGQPLYVQWNMASAGTCGLAPSGTLIQGKVTSAAGQNSYSVTVNRKPNPALPDISDTNVALGATVNKSLGTAVQGINTTAYITLGAASTGTNVRVSLDGGTTFVVVPSAPSTSMPVISGQTIIIEQTVGTAVNTSPGYTAIINVGDSTGSAGAAATFQTVTYTATTVSSAVFPGVTFTPTSGPNAAPESVTGVAGGGSLGTLEGFAPSNAWPAAYATTLSSPVSGANPTMKMRVGASPYATSGVAVAASNVVDIAWNEAYLATVADGSAANGSITGTVGGTTYTNTFTMTVKRSAGWTVTPDPGNAATGTQQTTNPLTVNNFNVPVTVSFAAPSTGTLMGNVVAVVDGVSTNINPITTTVTLNPGESFEVLGDTGGTGGNTYGVKITIGSSPAQDWLVTTSSVPNAIQAPVMSPTGGPLNPAANSPAGITLGGGPYTVASGAPGAHTSSDWQLFGNVGSTQQNPETSAILSTSNTSASWSTVTIAGQTQQYIAGAYGNGNYVLAGGNGQFATSPDLSTWTVGTLPGGGLNVDGTGGVTYANGQFVAVGQTITGPFQGKIYTSPDGTNWTLRQTISFATNVLMYGVTYGNNLYVAVGALRNAGGTAATGLIYTSPDGITWTSRSNPATTCGYYSVAYGNGKFVTVGRAVGSNPGAEAAYSIDGITWTSATIPGATQLCSVAFGLGKFVAFGQGTNDRFWTSPDGVNWTSVFTATSVTNGYSLIYSPIGFLAGVSSSTLYYSPDGTTWSGSTVSPAANFSSLVYGNGKYLLTGRDSSFASNQVLQSTSPVPTTTITLTNNTNLSNMVVGDSVVEVGGGADASGVITAINTAGPTLTVAPQSANWTNGATVKDTSRTIAVPNAPLVSTNQITGTGAASATWTGQTAPSAGLSLRGAAYNSGLYVVVGAGGVIITSPDGVAWTAQTSGTTDGLNGVTYANGIYVAVGAGERVLTSSNGTVWNSQRSGFAQNLNAVAYGNGTFVAVGGAGTIITSSNGAAWVPQTSGTPSSIRTVCYANSQFVAGGDSGLVLTSPDGVTWTTRPSAAISTLNVVGIAYGAGLYTVCTDSASGLVFTSPDGITWTSRTSNSTTPLNEVTFGGGLFTSVGGGGSVGTIVTSPDGITWTAQTSGTTQTLVGVVYGGNLCVAVGDNSTIRTSNAPSGGTSLTISAANTDGFAVGNLISNGVTGASAASGTIYAINGTTVTVAPPSANWANGQNLYRGETIVNVANDSSNLLTYLVPQASLTTSTTYYSRARYSASSTSTTSPWANWASFSTAASFPPPIGAALGGGYFAGQINVSGQIYNLIVAPVGPVGGLNGQYGGSTPTGITWKNAATGETGGNIALAQDAAYGKPWTDQAGTTGNYAAGTYPVFQWCKGDATGPNGGGGIGGFTDWYIPAKNELEVLYYYLKPNAPAGADANSTSSGSNPNAVAPEPVSTNYTTTNPAQTIAGLFQGTNAQSFSAVAYWSSTENLSSTSYAWSQYFDNGVQGDAFKSLNRYARAIRRVLA